MVLYDILTRQHWKRQPIRTHWECVPQQQSGKTNKKKSVCYFFFFMRRHELLNNTFSVQFPLNAVISHLTKTFQSPLSTALLIDLLPGCQVLTLSWHVCSSLFIPTSLCVFCECAYVQHCPAIWRGTSQIPQSLPKGPLHSLRHPRVRTPQSVPGQLRRTLWSRWELQTAEFCNNITFRCCQMYQTLGLLKVISSSITKTS